jgi:hypothetical protein
MTTFREILYVEGLGVLGFIIPSYLWLVFAGSKWELLTALFILFWWFSPGIPMVIVDPKKYGILPFAASYPIWMGEKIFQK